jgi:hypothetical protein
VNKSKKGKKAARKSSTSGRALGHTSASQRAPQRSSTSGKPHDHGSAMAEARKVLLASEAGTSGDFPLRIKNSFHEGHYSPLTGMEVSEW